MKTDKEVKTTDDDVMQSLATMAKHFIKELKDHYKYTAQQLQVTYQPVSERHALATINSPGGKWIIKLNNGICTLHDKRHTQSSKKLDYVRFNFGWCFMQPKMMVQIFKVNPPIDKVVLAKKK